jgi:hypothetical protein
VSDHKQQVHTGKRLAFSACAATTLVRFAKAAMASLQDIGPAMPFVTRASDAHITQLFECNERWIRAMRRWEPRIGHCNSR